MRPIDGPHSLAAAEQAARTEQARKKEDGARAKEAAGRAKSAPSETLPEVDRAELSGESVAAAENQLEQNKKKKDKKPADSEPEVGGPRAPLKGNFLDITE